MAPPPPPPPELLEDPVGEILLRVPPDEPAHLVRAALVCKTWRRILRDPGFLRRYREFHRAPPLLGILQEVRYAYRFVPTTSATFAPPAFACERWWALDCRHGRVLIHSFGPMGIFVWDPVTGVNQKLPPPPFPYENHNAALLCASDGCDHLDCHGRPFIVVFVGTSVGTTLAQVSVFTSETGAWSEPASIQLCGDSMLLMIPSTLARGALYFNLRNCILKYDLQHGQALSVIKLPPRFEYMGYTGNAILMVLEEGELGIASAQGHSIHLWSHQAASSGVAEWVECRVIEPDALKPMALDDPSTELDVVGFSEGTGTIFMSTNDGTFAFEIKSGQVRKVAESGVYYVIFPYVSFYTPDHASAKLQL